MPLRIGPASDATSWVLSRREAAPAAGRPRRCTTILYPRVAPVTTGSASWGVVLPVACPPWWYAVRPLGPPGAAWPLSRTKPALRDSVGADALMSWHLRHDPGHAYDMTDPPPAHDDREDR